MKANSPTGSAPAFDTTAVEVRMLRTDPFAACTAPDLAPDAPPYAAPPAPPAPDAAPYAAPAPLPSPPAASVDSEESEMPEVPPDFGLQDV